MRALFWGFILLVAAVLAAFAASNRESVALALWPLPFVAETPVFLVALGGLLLGFVTGHAAAWIGGSQRRRAARRCARRLAAVERELAATQARLPSAAPSPAAMAGG